MVAGRGMGWRSKALACHRDSSGDGLGSRVEMGPCPATGALLQTRDRVDVRSTLTQLLCGSLLCSSQPFSGHELGSECRKQ